MKSICFLKFGSEVTELANLKAIAVMVKFATGWHVVSQAKAIFDTGTSKFFPQVSKSSFLRIQKHAMIVQTQRFPSTANSELGWQ